MAWSSEFGRACGQATEVRFAIVPMSFCRKGHVWCYMVSAQALRKHPGGDSTRRNGPYEHLTMEQALDVVASLAAHCGSVLELERQAEELRESQFTIPGLMLPE